MSSPERPSSYPRHLTSIPYTTSGLPLHTLDICIPRPFDSSPPGAVWTIFIHGGAWRDPLVTSHAFLPTQSLLLKPPSPVLSQITAFASINYRLGPYPDHPTHPSSPTDPSRNARHPEHLDDVLAALNYLRREYGMTRWIVVGHSCGATIALQACCGHSPAGNPNASSETGADDADLLPPPLAVLGLEGVYDLPLLCKNHADQPLYREIVTNAFGDAEDRWVDASPVGLDFAKAWPNGRLIVLGQSVEDELVEWRQVDAMADSLEDNGWKVVRCGEDGQVRARKTEEGKEVVVVELKGEHDEIWEKGTEMVKAIEITIKRLLRE